MSHNICKANAVNCVLKRRLTAVGPFSRNKSHMFVPNKPLGSLLEISPTNHIFLKIFNSEYDKIKVWFTDQNSQPLEVEDRINLTMVIK